MATEKTTAFKRVQIVGDTAIVTSKIQFKTLCKLQGKHSNILCLAEKDNDGDIIEVFRIEAGPTGTLSEFGATFTCANKDGLAMTTVKIPCFVEDKKQYFVEEYGTALCYLEELEEQIAKTSKEIEKAYSKIAEQIEEVA